MLRGLVFYFTWYKIFTVKGNNTKILVDCMLFCFSENTLAGLQYTDKQLCCWTA